MYEKCEKVHERKFLILDVEGDHSTPALERICPIGKLVSMADSKGVDLIQGYVPVAFAQRIVYDLGLELPFNPDEAMLRKTFRNGETRYSFIMSHTVDFRERLRWESEVSKEFFDSNRGHAEYNLIKTRLVVPQRYLPGYPRRSGVHFDLYKTGEHPLILAEVKALSLKSLDSLEPLGDEVTGEFSYLGINLAEKLNTPDPSFSGLF